MIFKVIIQYASQIEMMAGSVCSEEKEIKKGLRGKRIKQRTTNLVQFIFVMLNNRTHGKLRRSELNLPSWFLTVEFILPPLSHSNAAVSLSVTPCCVWGLESVVPVSLKKLLSKAGGPLVCLLRSPTWPDGLGPAGSPSVIQDDFDKSGHVCVFGVVHDEKRMFH